MKNSESIYVVYKVGAYEFCPDEPELIMLHLFKDYREALKYAKENDCMIWERVIEDN